jgi:cytidine deaminase
MNKEFEQLFAAAQAAQKNAYAPYSNFFVGSALMTGDGVIYAGCNVENASYGLTICAERNAIFQMIAAGEREIKSLLVMGSTERLLPPCGSCRQVIAEFAASDTPVYLCNQEGTFETTTVGDLLPRHFKLLENSNDK